MRQLLSLLLLCGMCVGQQTVSGGTTAGDILPAATGQNLGNAGQRWNGFLQNLNVSGSSNVKRFVDVTDSTVGMVADGTTDNSAFTASLMTALSPTAGNGAGYEAVFPGVLGSNETDYYFSAPLSLSRSGIFRCTSSGFRTNAVRLIFAAGRDGVVFEESTTSADGGWSDGVLKGCYIGSLGEGTGTLVSGTNITGAHKASFASVAAVAWAAGDGVLGMKAGSASLDIPVGAYLDSVSGTLQNQTLTPHTGMEPTASGAAILYQLPAALVFSVTTASGSNCFDETAGLFKLWPGDLIWSDAFPFGTTVFTVSGALGVQHVCVRDRWLTSNANASVTHTLGSGKLWKIPRGIIRRTTSNAADNYIWGFPIGIQMSCTSGGTPGLNCTESIDTNNGVEATLAGRWTAGNNTGGSVSQGNKYVGNYLYDIMEGGTVGSLYVGDSSNSGASKSAAPVVGNCANQNATAFVGMYVDSGTGGAWNFCLTGSTVGSYFSGPLASTPADTPVYNAASHDKGSYTFNAVTGGTFEMFLKSPSAAGAETRTPAKIDWVDHLGIRWWEIFPNLSNPGTLSIFRGNGSGSNNANETYFQIQGHGDDYTITSAQRTSNIVSVVTTAHVRGLWVGAIGTLAGTTAGALDGACTVASITDDQHFTCTHAGVDTGSIVAGTFNPSQYNGDILITAHKNPTIGVSSDVEIDGDGTGQVKLGFGAGTGGACVGNGAGACVTSISSAGAITGIASIAGAAVNASVNHGVCWKTATTMGYCSTVLAADGTCTCN